MNKHYLILGLCGLLAFAACNEELDNPNTGKPGTETPTDVITTDSFVGISYEEPVVPEEGEAEVSPGTKVTYHKKGKVFSAQWSKEDCIYVTAAGADEEITLQPFQLEGEGGKAEGKFVGEPISGTTFSAVFSEAVPTVSADKKSIEVLFPAEQNYVAEGLEEHLVPMFAVTSDPQNLKFQYGSGILRLNLYSEGEEELSVSKIEVVTDVPAAGLMYVTPGSEIFPCGFSGGASVNDMEGVEVRSGAASTNTITYNVGGVTLGKTAETAVQFNIALAASGHCEEVEKDGEMVNAYKSMIVRVYTTDGQVMAKVQRNFPVLPGVVHEFSKLPFIDNSVPAIDPVRSTSTTLTFAWSQTGFANSANDRLDSYEAALYSDEACQNLVVSWTLPASKYLYRPFDDDNNTEVSGNDAFASFPAFTFTGLTPKTDYWFKVRNTNTGAVCTPQQARTAEFNRVAIGDSKVAAGNTVLAEDFSELVWGGDFVTPAAGYVANDEIRSVFSSATGADNSNYSPRKVSKDYNLYSDLAAAVGASRLGAWDYISEDGSKRNFSCAGYLRLGSGYSTSMMVTPVLSNLEDGKMATLTVKFKAAPYYDTNDPSKADLDDVCVAVVNSISENHKYADCTIGNVVTEQLEGTQNEWKEYTLEISGVTSSSRIAIGTYRPETENNVRRRMYLDDVEITVKKYDEVKARLQGATSSTLSFQWSGNGFTDAEADTKVPYTVALYKDAACTQLVTSWEISADNKNYHTGSAYYFQPAFNFSGLTANTTYYFKATDTKNNLVSNVVSATTAAFTNVPVEGTVAKGGTVLAEDFSQLIWNGDFVYPGISYINSGIVAVKENQVAATEFTPSEGDTHDGYELVSPSSETSLTDNLYKQAVAKTRLAGWSFNSEEDGTRVYGRLGHIKVGAGSYTGRIITPALTNLQQTATLKVSFKASPYYDHNQQSMIDPLDACIKVIATDGSELSAHKFTLKDEKNKWNDYSFNVINVEPGSKISIGTYRANGTAGKQQRRMYIDDIKIEVVEYTDAVGARLKRATSSTLTFEWSPSGFADGATDRAKAYTVSLYRDENHTDAVISWALSAQSAAKDNWYVPYEATAGAVIPAFIFTGLDPKTTYYFKVEDEDGWSSEAMGSTEAFEVVEVGSAKVPQGGTVLAEDFSELVWDADLSSPAAGYYPKSLGSKFVSAATGDLTKYDLSDCDTDHALFADNLKNHLTASRLADWGQTVEKNAGNRIFAQAGHLRIGSGDIAGSIVTPELSNLEEGKYAKVTLTFKACPYYDSNKPDLTYSSSVKKGLDPADVSIELLKGDITVGTTSTKLVSSTYKLPISKFNLSGKRNQWKEYTCVIENVTSESRIAIGTYRKDSKYEGQCRMYIDDIKIVVDEYSNYEAPVAELQGETSSTLSFKWSENNFSSRNKDYTRHYRVELYKNAACSDLFVSWNINNNSVYKSGNYVMQTAFNFSGLASNTSYWCKVINLESGLESNVVEGKTTAFTKVPVTATSVEQGGTLLAEDFSDLVWNGDLVYPGASCRASTYNKVAFSTAEGDNPTGFSLVAPNTEVGLFDANSKTAIEASSLKNWGYYPENEANNRLYQRLGFVKIGGGSKTSMIVTPELTNLSGTATLTVSFKTCPYYNDDQTSQIDPLDARVMVLNATSVTAESTNSSGGVVGINKISGTAGTTKDFELQTYQNTWTQESLDIENVAPGSRIAIGTYRPSDSGSGQRRMYIDEIVITVKSYNE